MLPPRPRRPWRGGFAGASGLGRKRGRAHLRNAGPPAWPGLGGCRGRLGQPLARPVPSLAADTRSRRRRERTDLEAPRHLLHVLADAAPAVERALPHRLQRRKETGHRLARASGRLDQPVRVVAQAAIDVLGDASLVGVEAGVGKARPPQLRAPCFQTPRHRLQPCDVEAARGLEVGDEVGIAPALVEGARRHCVLRMQIRKPQPGALTGARSAGGMVRTARGGVAVSAGRSG